MELKESILKRRTANKAFLQKAVDEKHIRELIEAANRAPSHFNSQPWDFIIVTDPAIRKEIGKIAGESMKELIAKGEFFNRYLKYFRFSQQDIDKRKTGIHIDRMPKYLKPFVEKVFSDSALKIMKLLQVPTLLGRDQRKIVEGAPMLLGFMLKKEEYKPWEKSGIYSLISMGAALQNMWLTATSLGMGLQFVSTPMEIPENWEKILKILRVPDTHELMAVYRIGYMDEKTRRNTIDWVSDERRTFEDLVSWNYYEKKE
ncbi:MAG: nitroreductase family protein [Leptospiraceae bacterium]|nr:nitroreductase family protein [Leptospiraceae bacterium]MCP5496429.1 nitroreductase family protein [Leptospiraceae bacterium]